MTSATQREDHIQDQWHFGHKRLSPMVQVSKRHFLPEFNTHEYSVRRCLLSHAKDSSSLLFHNWPGSNEVFYGKYNYMSKAGVWCCPVLVNDRWAG
jgi:hypothetical protein